MSNFVFCCEVIAFIILSLILFLGWSFLPDNSKPVNNLVSLGNKEFWIETKFFIYRVMADNKQNALECLKTKTGIVLVERIWNK